jgi:hypothetical protein
LLAPSKTPLPALLEDYCGVMSTFRTPKSYSADVSVLRIFFGPICPALELGTCVNRRFRAKEGEAAGGYDDALAPPGEAAGGRHGGED